ncbi:MAG: hypothetical protein ABS75_17630 [Pelagibacterium sp. SCN 63-23]|nr:MAG: hypothetical protein ABS75_17630 [Pelagibacterium sp. SCN 63-23]
MDHFIEEMGLLSQESGEPRISGRILGLLVVEGRELSLGQISEKLGISRASASTNARLLARRGMVHLTARAGDRQDYYELSPLPLFDRLWEIAEHAARNGRTIGACVEAMRSENAAAADRAMEIQIFFEKSSHVLHKWAEALRDDAAQEKDLK